MFNACMQEPYIFHSFDENDLQLENVLNLYHYRSIGSLGFLYKVAYSKHAIQIIITVYVEQTILEYVTVVDIALTSGFELEHK